MYSVCYLIYCRHFSIYSIESWRCPNLPLNSLFLFCFNYLLLFFKNFTSNFSCSPLAIFSCLCHITFAYCVIKRYLRIKLFLSILLLNKRVDIFKFRNLIFKPRQKKHFFITLLTESYTFRAQLLF